MTVLVDGARRLMALWHSRVNPIDYMSEWIKEQVELRNDRRLLQAARAGRDVCWKSENPNLVTIRIATYNRGPLILERSIASALNQTHDEIEILVIGDACDDATASAVETVKDPRLRFVNLPRRGIYPEDPKRRWMVAGCAPMNEALRLARGAWIAPCDDDDELTADHVEVLLNHAREHRLEMVYSKARMETSPGEWKIVGSEPLRHSHITHGSVLYSSGLRFVRHNGTSWKLHEPADWNMWRRMHRLGVRIGFLDRITYIHYLEAYNRDVIDP